MGAEPTPETTQDEPALGPSPFRLLSLRLDNFRGFVDLTLDLPKDGPAVLIGVNGAGKSAVLDAIAMHLSWFAAVTSVPLSPYGELKPTDGDIHVNSATADVEATFRLHREDRTWNLGAWRTPNGTAVITPKDAEIHAAQAAVKRSADGSVPVLCSYPATRGLLADDDQRPARPRRKTSAARFDAYEGAFGRGLGPFRDFVRWFGGAEDIENEGRLRRDPEFRNPQLQAIRAALVRFLNELGAGRFSDLRAERLAAEDGSVKTVELSVVKDGTRFGLRQLSEGERNTLVLVSDIARRLAIANPAAEDPLQGSGIVLIDEIDLHLHPAWQRGVIPALSDTFPHIQFIVSTHSPSVLSRVKREHVFILENFELVRKAPHTYGRDANTILAEVMGVPPRPKDIEDMIRSASILVDEERLEEAKRALDELTNILGGDDNFVVRLRTLISFLEDDR